MNNDWLASHRFHAVLLLSIVGIISACGLRDVFSRYQTTVLAPSAKATFVVTDHRSCPRFPAETNTGALPPPLFRGAGTLGVGYNGQFRVGSEHHIHSMQGVVRFNLDGIPPVAATPLLAATLRFRLSPTSQSGLDDPHCTPVAGIERAATPWDPALSDFSTHLSSEPFPPLSTCTVDGNRYECNVSKAVQDWLADPAAHPNFGFVIKPAEFHGNACADSFGAPGNRVECAAEIIGPVLVVQYLPPEER
jgi:hypothetical protein